MNERRREWAMYAAGAAAQSGGGTGGDGDSQSWGNDAKSCAHLADELQALADDREKAGAFGHDRDDAVMLARMVCVYEGDPTGSPESYNPMCDFARRILAGAK